MRLYHQPARDRYPISEELSIPRSACPDLRARHLSNRTLLAGMEGGPRGDHTIVIGVSARECRVYDHGINLDGCGFR